MDDGSDQRRISADVQPDPQDVLWSSSLLQQIKAKHADTNTHTSSQQLHTHTTYSTSPLLFSQLLLLILSIQAAVCLCVKTARQTSVCARASVIVCQAVEE